MQTNRLRRQRGQKEKLYLDLVRELKKALVLESDNNTISNWYVWNDPQRLGKMIRRFGEWAENIHTRTL